MLLYQRVRCTVDGDTHPDATLNTSLAIVSVSPPGGNHGNNGVVHGLVSMAKTYMY
jgi:hypothetical protein